MNASSLWPPAPFRPTGTTVRVAAFAPAADGAADLRRSAQVALGPLALPTDAPTLPLRVAAAEPGSMPAEGFELRIEPEGVGVRAADAAGVTWACVALRQLLGPEAWRTGGVGGGERRAWDLPCGVLVDAPALSWRGVLLDVVRHFVPVRDVLAVCDLMSAHRLNRLHLHLSDDQGWRVESRAHPRLTEIGTWREQTVVGSEWELHLSGADPVFDGTPHGGYYTPADLAEITAYARDRGILLVPEIDLPGHCTPLLAAIPDLRVPELRERDDVVGGVWGRWGVHPNVVSPLPEALEIVAGLLAEVAGAVDSPWMHVGGDECLVDQWEDSAAVADFARRRGLVGPGALRAHVNGFLTRTVAELGRRPVVWDEAFVGGNLHPGTAVMVWRTAGLGPVAARAGFDVIQTPEYPTYLSWAESLEPGEPLSMGGPVPLADVARWDVGAGFTGTEPGRLLGGQGALWSEYIPDARTWEYFAFPRLAALAAGLWRGGPVEEPAAWAEHLRRLRAMGVGMRPTTGPAPWQAGGTGARASCGQKSRRPPVPDVAELLRGTPYGSRDLSATRGAE